MREITFEKLAKVVENAVYVNTWEDVICWIKGYKEVVTFADLEVIKQLYDKGLISETW